MQYNLIENASDPRKTRERPAKMDPPLPSLQDHPKNQRFFGDPGREGAYPAGDISRRERGGRAREEARASAGERGRRRRCFIFNLFIYE